MDKPQSKYEQYFESAKAKMRQTGAGGISVPNPDLTLRPQDPIKTDPNRQVILKNDWVMVGGRNVKTTRGPRTSVQILSASEKILESNRKTDAAKKDQKSN